MKHEPALLTQLVAAAVSLAVAFGWHLTDVQIAALSMFLQMAAAVVTRQNVYSLHTIENMAGTLKAAAASAKRKPKPKP